MARRIFRVLLWVVGGLAGVLLLILLVGWLLPHPHSFARQIELAQPPQAVWDVIADFPSQPEWRKDTARVEPAAECGAGGWKITTTHNSYGYFRATEAAPPQLLVLDHLDPGCSPTVVWRLELEPQAQGSRLVIRETGDFGNPFSRFMVRFVLGQTKFVDDYLTYLAARFGEQTEILDAP